MFKNCVFKVSVDTKEWWKAAVTRAVKTVAQTAVAMITVGATATEIDWLNILSVSAVAGIASLLTSIGGIPEVSKMEVKDNE